jgi:hypothetical protein
MPFNSLKFETADMTDATAALPGLSHFRRHYPNAETDELD